ncbi:MAG: MarR family winged helix-turn-helix transcriptional regulator [Rhodoglobus sp.]
MNAIAGDERELWRAFLVMRHQLELTLERRLHADSGISSADFEILSSLSEEPTARLRAGRIADLIGWEKSRVSHQLGRMEQRGLVKRVECGDDARGVWVVLTADGSQAVANAARDHAEAIREYFLDVLDEEHKLALLTASRRVLDVINPPVFAPEIGAEDRVDARG